MVVVVVIVVFVALRVLLVCLIAFCYLRAFGPGGGQISGVVCVSARAPSWIFDPPPPPHPCLWGVAPLHPPPSLAAPPHTYNIRPRPVRFLVLIIKRARHTSAHIILHSRTREGTITREGQITREEQTYKSGKDYKRERERETKIARESGNNAREDNITREGNNIREGKIAREGE